jgi:hypothetical protein
LPLAVAVSVKAPAVPSMVHSAASLAPLAVCARSLPPATM